MYKRILLPLDGSQFAEQALPHAAALVERFQAELILLKVLEPVGKNINLPPRATRKAEEAMLEFAREYLERTASDIRKMGISVRVVTVPGSPHAEIVQFAERENVDLIVICTRGQSGLSRWLMGSVADRVARGDSIPVLLVRPQKDRDELE
jgi:nucleotide-binding universal stress UspA family protein